MKNLLKALLNKLIRLFWIFPIKKNKIVFRSSMGKKYNCNPKYISEYLLENCKNEFDIVWLLSEPERYSYLKKKGVKIFKPDSLGAVFSLSTAGFIIDNHGIQSYLPKRNGQTVINTWHGGGSYKKGKKECRDFEKDYTALANEKTDYFISSCEKFSKNNLADIYEKRPSAILPFGMARNDLFFTDTESTAERVKKALSIPEGTGLIMFAPTFRLMNKDTNYGIDSEAVIEACEKRFSKPFVFGYRLHEFIENNASDLKAKKLLSLNSYEDMQELIAAADVIITDYSSLIWDAAVAKKPCFIFAKDLADYMDFRGFFTPINEWPFPLSESNEKLFENIVSFNEGEYLNAVSRHLSDLGSYETGESAKRTAELIKNILQKN